MWQQSGVIGGLAVMLVRIARDWGSIPHWGTEYFWIVNCYRPQRSWGKVIFSQVSVILLTGGVPPPGRGGAFSGGCLLGGGASSRGCLLPEGGGASSRGCLLWEVCLLPAGGGAFSGGASSRGVPPLGGASSWGEWLVLGVWGTGGDPLGRLLLRAVRILLECILVTYFIHCFTISKAERKVEVWANFLSFSPNKLNGLPSPNTKITRVSF